MADADWANYKQLRGKTLPQTIDFRGAHYRQEKLFKRDFYAATGLYLLQGAKPSRDLPRRVVLNMYHTEPIALVPLGSLGRRLCSREVYYFAKMTGIPGLPRVLAQNGVSGYIREFVPGCDLREYRKTHGPNELFYAKLKVLLASIHAQGISHNDLSKPENNPRSTRRHAGDYRLPDRGRLLVALAHFETARPSGP